MTTQRRPDFRLRLLLDPAYMSARFREKKSVDDYLVSLKGLVRYGRGLVEKSYYGIRGTAGGFAARAEARYYWMRGLRGYVKARAEDLYYKADLPSYRLKLGRKIGAPAVAATHAAPDVGDLPAVEENEAGAVLSPELLAREAELAGQFQAARPFRHVVIDGFLDAAFCRRLIAEFPPYDPGRFRNEHGHLGKAHHEKVASLGPAYRKLDRLIQTPDFLQRMSAITGIPDLIYDPQYFGGGTHENLEGMELDPHVDFTVHPDGGHHRRVNLLLYLNPEWDESWGGALELHENPWLPPERNPIRTVVPAFNRCVLFETSDRSWHGFQAVRLPASRKGLTRRSFALYLYTREPAPGATAIPSDLTVFVDRPLPPEFRAGRRLSEEDVRVLKHLIVRRDWKLHHLYDRSIALFNDWQLSQAQLRETLASLVRLRAQAGTSKTDEASTDR